MKFDLLSIVSVNMGDELITRSGMGDDLNFVPTNQYTLQSLHYSNIFVIGEASNIPTTITGSVPYFSGEILLENIKSHIESPPLNTKFDRHANCFIEIGYGKGSIIDFNYKAETLAGTFPFPGLGPFALLKTTKMNHYGKRLFRWIYWHVLLPGKESPVKLLMSMVGKFQ